MVGCALNIADSMSVHVSALNKKTRVGWCITIACLCGQLPAGRAKLPTTVDPRRARVVETSFHLRKPRGSSAMTVILLNVMAVVRLLVDE